MVALGTDLVTMRESWRRPTEVLPLVLRLLPSHYRLVISYLEASLAPFCNLEFGERY